MNFDFEKFKKLCRNFSGVLDLRNKDDRRAFTAYMLNNDIKYTRFGKSQPFVYVGNLNGCVYGTNTNFMRETYTIQDFLLPEFFDMDNILEFLGGE